MTKVPHPNSVFWTAGDLNLPDINWPDHSINGNRYHVEINQRALVHLERTFQEQQVDRATFPASGNILDLFLTNRPSLTTKCTVIPGLSDHCMVYASASLTAKHVKNPKRQYHDWRNRNNNKL